MSKRTVILFLLAAAAIQLGAQEIFDPTRPKEKVKTPYTFSMQYRLEVGYAQNFHFSRNDTYTQMYLHGGQVGFSIDFMLKICYDTKACADLGGNDYDSEKC